MAFSTIAGEKLSEVTQGEIVSTDELMSWSLIDFTFSHVVLLTSNEIAASNTTQACQLTLR